MDSDSGSKQGVKSQSADQAQSATRVDRRKLLKAIAGGSAATALGMRAPAVLGQAKPFAGVTLNGACFQHVFQTYLKEFIPEFEAATGMTVNLDLQAFPVYNQRMDLELSTKGSAYDFCNITFIYSGRWIGAGWMSPLEEFYKDPNRTPASWDAADFAAGAQSSMQDAKGATYGFAWEAGAMIMGAARGDLIEKAGMKMPTTFDELVRVCEATKGRDNVAPYVADRLHHWNWIPYLMGLGGKVFRGPPEDLFPLIDTKEAIAAAEWYASLLVKYGPSGVLSYTDDQAMRAQIGGRANIRTQAIGWMTPLVKHAESTVKTTARYGLMPAGPAGNFPGSNSHGFGIPLGSKKKAAAWEFIKWAMSKETLRKIALTKGYSAVCRRSIINDPEYRNAMTLNGQDVASLYLQVLDLGGKGGYMKYRTVPVFPQVGDKINKAIERIATNQQKAPEAMKQAQVEAIADLQKAGIKV
ncbi:MAG: ABC transporter substrate-binding protein [Burkholderiales bacterium]